MSITERLTKRHPNGVVGISKCRYYNFDDFQKMAKKLAEYEDIGTVSEFKQLKEKATPKKIGHCVFYREMGYGTPWQCPTCGADQLKAEFSSEEEKHTFCWKCRQRLDWS